MKLSLSVFAATAVILWGILFELQAAVPTTKIDATATNPPSFSREIRPILATYGCSAVECHGSANGKGGLRLSMFGAYPEEDYAALVKSAGGRRINPVEPAKSLLLLKVTGTLPHAGTKKIPLGSPEYKLLLSWIAQGAPWGDEKAARLVSLKITPEKQTLQKGQTGKLTIQAVYSDGLEKDVTRDAMGRSLDAGVATWSSNGQVTAKDYGEAVIVVSYLRHFALGRVLVPQPLAKPFPETPANNKIDQLVLSKLTELGFPPSELCSDQEFIRRVYLDVIGLLPTPEEVKTFLADKDPQKRSKLIDRLLERSEYADFWALKWGDLLRIKSEYPINLWPNAVQAYHHWVRDSIAKNKPYDQFVREQLIATGSNFRNPPANYYRAVSRRDAQALAESTAVTFMGVRMECARCHGHPSENWSLRDNKGMAAFFSQVRYKNTQEWKEEIVFLDPKQVLRDPLTRQPVTPKFLDGETMTMGPEDDPRAKFAEWLTSPQNPYFARNIVNRIWYWLLGRGIIHEPDDLRLTNPPTNPELLAYLESELVAHKYDLKHIYRQILNSRTYQLSSAANEGNVKDATHFSHYPIKRLGAEQLMDAVGRVTETSEQFSSRIPEPYTTLPEGFRATQLFDGSIGTAFLELFGRPPRDTPFECDRNIQTSMRQALFLINSQQIEQRIARSPRMQRWLKEKKSDAEIIDEIYLAALSRLPSEEEKQKLTAYLAKEPKNRNQAVQDVVWAILNTKEFLFNH